MYCAYLKKNISDNLRIYSLNMTKEKKGIL